MAVPHTVSPRRNARVASPRSRAFRFRSWWPAAGVALLTACGGGPNGPSPPPPVQNLALTCPTNVVVQNVAGSSADVQYSMPQVTGGKPPITVTCSPRSGSTFQLGTTTVNCDATDGVRVATCPFSVTLVPVPVLRDVKFLAFGDSITNGEVQNNPLRPTLRLVERDKSYPTVLGKELSERYVSQTITVVNEGQSGETAEDGTQRIGGALARNRPDALLLLQGVIDLDGRGGIPGVISALRSDIAQARAQGVRDILLSTLLPQKTAAPGFPRNNVAMPFIEDANREIRALAAREGVLLVDSFAAMVGKEATLIGGDGLHPTEEGYVALADAFFAVIREKLEAPVPSTTAPGVSIDQLRGRSRMSVVPFTR